MRKKKSLLTKVAKGIAYGDVSNSAVRNILTEISKKLYEDIDDKYIEEAIKYFNGRCPYTDEDLSPLIAQGSGYATDHIYPQNRTWCGLNVKGNLVVVTKRANDKKHSRDVRTFLMYDTDVLGNIDMQTRRARLQKIEEFQKKYNYEPDNIRKILSPLMEDRYEEIRKEQEACIAQTMEELEKNGIYPTLRATSVSPTPKTQCVASGGRDYSKYIFNSKKYTKGALLVALVEKYLEDNPHADVKELKEKFDLILSFGNKHVILLYSDVPKSWTENKVYGRPLLDGTMVYINKQVQIGDMDEILRIAGKLGYGVAKA